MLWVEVSEPAGTEGRIILIRVTARTVMNLQLIMFAQLLMNGGATKHTNKSNDLNTGSP